MAKTFRKELTVVLKQQFEALINKHRMNIEVLLENNVGVAEHGDIVETIEKELAMLADYNDKLETLNKFFPLPGEEPRLP